MPKIKIYIDADGIEHRVDSNSESRFLREYEDAEFSREEYVFGDNSDLNDLYNTSDFDLETILNEEKTEEETEEELDPAGEYTYQPASQLNNFKSGWYKTTLAPPLLKKETTVLVDEDEVPNEYMDLWRTETMDKFNNNPDDVSNQEIMEIMRPDRDQLKKEETRIAQGFDDYLSVKDEKPPKKPQSTSTIPQNALIGNSDIGDMAYVQGNVAATTKEMDDYNANKNFYDYKQKENNNSEFAEYYQKALDRFNGMFMSPASEEEVIAEAKRIARSEYNAKMIKRNLTQLAESQSKTTEGNVLVSDEQKDFLKRMEDYYGDIGTRYDEEGNAIMGPKMQESFQQTNLTENFLSNNAETIKEDKVEIDKKQKHWRDKFENIEQKLEKYSDIPATIDTLNDLNTQIKSYSDKAEGGKLNKKDYKEYIALVNKYNSIYNPSKKEIKKYVDLQKQYQDLDFEYKSEETEGGKKDIENSIKSYNSLLENQSDLYKTYQLQIDDQNGMIEDEQDLGIYLDVMSKNHNNFAQFGGIVTNSLIDIGMTLESTKHALNPRTLITDGLKEYYKGDPGSAPDLVKGLFMANDYMNIPRDNMRDAVKGVQDYLTGSIQDRVQWKDLGDGVDDGYEWGEYILGSAADFIPQLALMVAAPQASLYVLAASSAGGKYEQLKEENQHGANYSMADIYFASAITGVTEYATEKTTLGLLRKTGAIDPLLTQARNLGWREGTAKIFNPRNLGRGAYDMASESTSEVFAKMGENFGDKIAGKNISIYEGIDEAAFNGLVMSGIIKTPVAFRQAVAPFMRPEDSYVIQKNDKRIIEIEQRLQNPDISENARGILKSELDDILIENNKLLSKVIDNVDDMSTKEKKVVIEADKKLHETKELISQIKNDDSIKEKDKTELIKQATDKYYEARKAKNEVLKEVNLRHDIKTAEKAAKKIGIETFETVETRNEFQKQYEKLTGKKNDKRNADAFIVGNKVYINKTRAKEVGAVSAGSHELLHGIMNSVINDADGNLTKEGSVLIKSFLNSLSSKERAIVQKRIDDNYRYERGPNREITSERKFEEYAEEYLNSYADAIRKKEINPGEGTLTSIGRSIGDFFYGKGYENLEFNNGRDVKNFLKDFTKDIKLGEVRQSILDVAGPEGAKIGKVKMSESAFEDATVVEDLGLKGNTAKIVERNKKIEDAILREGVKDKDGNIIASPRMQRALAENNLPRAFALARQAANKGNDLTLEEGLKMNDVKEFFSEYSLKLMDLTRTYKAEMKDSETGKVKKVPFGAYMNSLLPLKYSGILNKLKSKIQASSMSEEATAKEVGKISTPSGELASNEVEGKKVALETIGEQETQEQLVNIAKGDPSLSKLRKYKDVKTKLVKHRKFMKDGTEITSELKAQYKKDGKKPPKELKSLRDPFNKDGSYVDPLYAGLEAVSAIFGVDPLRIIREQDLDTIQRKSAQDAILAKTNEIIAMMPFGTTASGDATGIANTTLGIFYKKLGRTTMKATGTGKGLAKQQKQNIDPTKFRALVGLIKNGRINNTSVDGAIRAVIVQVAAIANNQAVRQVYGPETLPLKDGKASAMFSETYQQPFLQEMSELSRAMQKEQGSWESIAKRFGFDPINMNTEEGRNEFEDWMFNNLNQYLPLSFFQHSGNWTGSTIGAIEADGTEIRLHARNLMYRNVVELHEAIEAAMRDGRAWQGEAMSEKDKQDIANALFRVKLTDSSLTDSEFKNSKQRGFELIWKQFDKMMKDNPNNARGILALLSSSSSQQNHFMRTGSINEFTNLENGKTVEEHQQPATDLAKFLFNRLAQKNLFKGDTFKNAIAGYQQGKLLKIDDDKLKNTAEGWSYQSNAGEFMYSIFAGKMPIWVRYFNPKVNNNNGGINPNAYKLANGNTIAQEYSVDVAAELTTPSVIAKQQDLLFQIFTGLTTQAKAAKAINSLANAKVKQNIKENKTFSNAVKESRTISEPKGITVLDFDDTLATSKSKVISTSPDGTIRKLTAEEFAKEGADLLEQGWTHDFSEFKKVVEGKVASLFKKALKLQKKFGPENMFILTARPAESAGPIQEFLRANGLNIPLKNITGLGNSTSEAKAFWIAEKVGEGYNDFYFADDALQNVQAVKNMLDQFDVKSKVQQAKVKFSETMNTDFNNIIESTTGVESEKNFSDAQAKIRGARTKYKSIIPASAQDFAGLIYNFLGKGKKGEADMAFFKKALIDPFSRGINELNASRQSAANDYKNLQKAFPDVKKTINKKIKGTEFTNDQAARVYLWDKAGFEIPGLSKRDLKTLVDHVNNNPDLQAFADSVGLISKKEAGYSAPGDFWLAENITSDLLSDGAIGDARADVLAEWQQNVDIIFSPENLNKIEAIYGSNFREALQDMLYRMKTGRNRPAGGGRLMNMYMNWVNNSVGAIMFFNMRSALLQTISSINFINWSDNNPLKAAAAFANQPQYWKDFSMLFNSDYLKQRRAGNQRGINEAELSAAVAGAENKAKAAIAWLLKKGFLPTQIADSFAIASGGATFYRNRIKKYVKEGMTQKQAEKQAFLDFQETSEVAQQSARPDMISQQQASPLGRLILSFQNTPMQYARIINKAARDLVNGRGDSKTNVSKIIYYGVAQGILFGSLQSALFAALGQDDEEEYDKKKERILNQMVDSVLSGIGYGGKAISTVKNTLMEYKKQKSKEWGSDHTYTILTLLGFSPPIGSKLRKIYGSIQTERFNEDVFKRRGFTLDNPIWNAIGNVIEGVTNIPLGRMSNKMLNLDNAMDSNNEWWQRIALVMGWNTWDLGIKDKDIEEIKTEIKEEKKIASKEKAKIKKEEKKKEKEEENKAIIEENKKKSKKDGICSAISKGGVRCKSKAVNGGFCTVHEKVEQNETGKQSQCKKVKGDGKRCKMQTSNKSGYCYYHD